MKQVFIFLLLVAIPGILKSQSLTNAENYQVGTVIKFQKCASGMSPGSAGASQTWNFASLTAFPDTLIQTILHPSATPYGGKYPQANLAEKFSDGRFVFLDKTSAENRMVGVEDPANNVSIHYPNPMVAIKRPLMFGSVITDTFTTSYTASGFNFRGAGTTVATVDGQGTLILPNGTYTNVLRVKIKSDQTDTLLQFGTVSTTTAIVYAWYNALHTSALLQMESISSGSFSQENVKFLLSETNTATGIAKTNLTSDFQVFPNPAGSSFSFVSSQGGKLIIADQLGRVVREVSVQPGQTKAETKDLAPGLYHLTLQTKQAVYSSRLVLK